MMFYYLFIIIFKYEYYNYNKKEFIKHATLTIQLCICYYGSEVVYMLCTGLPDSSI